MKICMANTSIPRCVWAMNGNKKWILFCIFWRGRNKFVVGKKRGTRKAKLELHFEAGSHPTQSQEVDKILNREYKRKWTILANSENLVSSSIKFETKEAKTSDLISNWRKFSSSWIIQPNGAWWESRRYLCWNLIGGILEEYHHGLKVECDLD